MPVARHAHALRATCRAEQRSLKSTASRYHARRASGDRIAVAFLTFSHARRLLALKSLTGGSCWRACVRTRRAPRFAACAPRPACSPFARAAKPAARRTCSTPSKRSSRATQSSPPHQRSVRELCTRVSLFTCCCVVLVVHGLQLNSALPGVAAVKKRDAHNRFRALRLYKTLRSRETVRLMILLFNLQFFISQRPPASQYRYSVEHETLKTRNSISAISRDSTRRANRLAQM